MIGDVALNTVKLVEFASKLKTWEEMVAWTPYFCAGGWTHVEEELRLVNPVFLALLSGGQSKNLVQEIYVKEAKMYDEDTMVAALTFLDYWGVDVKPLGDSEAYEIWQDDCESSEGESFGSDSSDEEEEVDDGQDDDEDDDMEEEEDEEEEEED